MRAGYGSPDTTAGTGDAISGSRDAGRRHPGLAQFGSQGDGFLAAVAGSGLTATGARTCGPRQGFQTCACFWMASSRMATKLYSWTLTGTHTGPGGTERPVHISGFDLWTLGKDGFIAQSQGHFDSPAYQRQLEHGIKQ
jgi:hypothetical protein